MMDADACVADLSNKHADLERAIDEEIQRPMPDSLLVSQLKRQKLRIKDEIFRLQHQ